MRFGFTCVKSTLTRPLVYLLLTGMTGTLAACTSTILAPSYPPSPSVAESLLRQWLEAQNRGDVPAVMALFNDDATLESLGGGCFVPTPCVGKPRIQQEIERRLGDRNQHIIISIQTSGTSITTDGDIATARTDVRSNAVRLRGFERVIRFETVQAAGRKISHYCLTSDISDPNTQTFAGADGARKCTLVTQLGQ